MEKFGKPDNYAGEDFSDYYVAIGRNRDSDVLTESNWHSFIKIFEDNNIEILNAEDCDFPNLPNAVLNVRQGHWTVGWIELILIPESNEKAVKLGNEIEEKLNCYPVLDEEDFSSREWESASEYWASLSIAERVEILQRFDECIFSARFDSLPPDESGHIFEYLTSNYQVNRILV